MRAAIGFVLLSVFAILGFLAGLHWNNFKTTVSPEAIERAQAASFYSAKPNWLGLTNQDQIFEGMRDRGYAYCATDGKIDQECAFEQDEAVQFSTLSLVVADAQQKMADKERLGRKELYVATSPEIVPRVLDECWSLYKEHGGRDARILSVCLGNLTDASPLVQLPVE